jgi:hypothetical protein
MNFDFNINNSSNKEKIKIYKITSDSFFEINNQNYNLIYIDGSHDLEYITRDIKNSYNCLEKGGIMWIDDYKGGGPENNNLQKTIDQVLLTLTEPYEIIHKEYQLAIRKF